MSRIRFKYSAVPTTPPVGTIILFVDSADNRVKTIDSDGLISILDRTDTSKFEKHASDAAYVVVHGAADASDVYYNTTSDAVRFYNGVAWGNLSGATEFSDSTFRIQNFGDATKKIAFDASIITTGTTQTITMPDEDIDLGALPGVNVTIESLNVTPAKTVQRWFDHTQSAGYFGGGEFTDNLDGSLTVASGDGIIKATDVIDAVNMFFIWDENVSVTLTDNSTNYIYVSYNGGTPLVQANVTAPTDVRTNILLGQVFREGTTLHRFKAGMFIPELGKNVLLRFIAESGQITRTSGAVVSETGTRNIAVTNGVVWGGLTRNTTTGYDTSVSGDFEYYYYNGSAWLESDETQIDNLQYNDTASGLATLPNNKYGVHWVYVAADGVILVVYGQDNYNLSKAEAAQPPGSLPSHVADFSFLAAKIVIKKSGAVFTEIQSAYDISFTNSVATVHNDLASLQGGTADEYYHTTAAEYALYGTPEGTAVLSTGETGGVKFLGENGDGTCSFLVPSGSGDVAKVGTPVDNQVGVWTGDGTIEGTAGLIYDGTNFLFSGDIGATGTRITKGWFTDLQVTNNITGSITGNAATVSTISGLAPDTATTQATQPNITTAAGLPWTGLKPGVDGEIPTFNASGNPAFVAVGTATHVLTSNGPGAAPTFQAGGGGGGGYTNLTQFVDQTAWRLFYSDTAGDVTELALGADGTFLKSNGAAVAPTFATPAGSGDVTKVGTPVNNQVGVWTGDGTLEGTTSLTYDGTTINLDNAVTINDSGAFVDFRVATDTNVNTFFVDGADGIVNLGHNDTVAARLGQSLEINASDAYAGLALAVWSTVGTDAAMMEWNASRSATIGTHSIVANNDTTAVLSFRASDGVAFQNLAAIYAQVDGTTGVGDIPGRLVFRTSLNGTTALTTHLTIDNSGGILMHTLKSGATSAGAGAVTDELWITASHATLPDNVVMRA